MNADAPGGRWRPAPHPDWLRRVNDEGRWMDLPRVVPLDEAGLTAAASAACDGLDDFGDGDWKAALGALCRALEDEAQLTLMGRLVARAELLVWLGNRLRLSALWKSRPEILAAELAAPVFITGLPRSGTSILHELLATDKRLRAPLSWEALHPCPSERSDEKPPPDPALVERADQLLCLWERLAPEYRAMHKMGARLPCECGLLMANTLISDHIAALYQIPSYHQAMAGWPLGPVYGWHRRLLSTLQWREPLRPWLLKAPAHLSFLPQLFEAYPDARVIQTHRDPLQCMASTASLLGTIYWMRSDQPFEATAFEDTIIGEATAARLDEATRLRDEGAVPAGQFLDSRYQDLMADPVAALERVYGFLRLPFGAQDAERVEAYLRRRPKDKFGVHRYAPPDPGRIAAERPCFAGYQARYGVPSEL